MPLQPPSEGLSYRFTEAVVRRPGASVIDGLRAVDRGAPDPARFLREHDGYVAALERAGLKVTVLPPAEAFPDSVFIEDTALCLPEASIILRPGAPSRAGEAAATAEALTGLGHTIAHLDPEGHLDGGDVLVTDQVFLVGLSSRSDQPGFRSLRALLRPWGYRAEAVRLPDGVLHLKSECCVLDAETVLATARLARDPVFSRFRILTVPEGEEAAANSVRINDRVLVPEGFPATAARLARAGFTVEALPATQAARLDGGLSCLSVRFATAASPAPPRAAW
jgi:dimethylargininase